MNPRAKILGCSSPPPVLWDQANGPKSVCISCYRPPYTIAIYYRHPIRKLILIVNRFFLTVVGRRYVKLRHKSTDGFPRKRGATDVRSISNLFTAYVMRIRNK